MQKFHVCALVAALLPVLSGCGGESAESRMRKQAQAMAQVNKEKEAKMAAMSGGSSPEGAASGDATLPKTTAPAAATPAPASANSHVAPAAVTAPAAALPAQATVEQRRARTLENLAKIGKALNAYADGYAGYPITKTPGSVANPPMSWRVAILPLLGYDSLFKQYRPAEPWDSTSNKQMLAKIPREFQSPDRRDTKTNYLVPLGVEAAFGCGRRLNAGMFEDGPDYTLIVVEVDDAHAVEWTRPDDLIVQGVPIRSKAGSLRGDGFFGVLASGRVCRIKPDADELALKALFTISSGDTEQIRDAIQDATAVPVPPPAAEEGPTVAAAPMPPQANPKGPGGSSPPGGSAAKKPAATPPANKVPFDEEPGSASAAATAAKPKERLHVPSESALTAARASLKDLYAKDYKEATTAQARRDLAAKLLKCSTEVGEDHAARYELLRIARDLSAQNGDLTAALKTLGQLEEKFEVDGPALRLETFKLFQKSADALSKSRELAAEAEKLVAEAIEKDNYDVAEEALKIEKGAAKRGAEQDKLFRAGKVETWLEGARRAYLDLSKAAARLEANPNDPQANQIVGTYHGLVKGRWEQGLPHLEKASDLKLRFLAKLDLSSSKTPQEMFDLANQYWDVAEQRPQLEERGFKLRAAYWYALAAKELADGLDKVKARKRLADISEVYGQDEIRKATGGREIAAISGAEE